MTKKILVYLHELCYSISKNRIGIMKVVRMKKKYDSLDIAKWFLWKNKVNQLENETEYDDKYEVYEGLTHLKLQKLLYFAQGVNLAINNKVLFNDKINAWTHGPVVKKVYDEFKKWGRDEIKIELTPEDMKKIEEIELDYETSNVLNVVYDNLCIYTAWQLREMTHIPGGPWETTVRTKGMDKEIPVSLIKEYFQNQVVDSD